MPLRRDPAAICQQNVCFQLLLAPGMEEPAGGHNPRRVPVKAGEHRPAADGLTKPMPRIFEPSWALPHFAELSLNLAVLRRFTARGLKSA